MIKRSWEESFSIFYNAKIYMKALIEETEEEELTHLENLGIIHSFNLTCNLLCEAIIEYIEGEKLEYDSETDDFITVAHRNGLILDQELWYELMNTKEDIREHSFDYQVAKEISEEISNKYFSLIEMTSLKLQEKFS